MEEKKLIPKRRFEGFEGDWYKNKLKNLASFSKGRGYSKNDIKNRGTELLLYGSLYTSYQTIVDKVNVYTKKKPNSVLSNGEEVVVPSSGETKEDIARASAIVKSGIIIGGDLNIIQPTEELNSVFLALEISNGSSQQELIRRAQGSAVVHLYNDDLKSVVIYYPDLKEQQKIGKFFRVLDERIANQERKIAKVKALKEAYLAEMFPQEGETVPKRRFKGFEGKWRKKKLGDFGTVEMNKRIFKWQTTEEGDVPFYKIGTFGKKPDSFIPYELFQKYKQKYPYPQVGDLLISASGSIGKIVEYTGKDEYFQDSNIVWLKHDGKLNNLFLKQFYNIVKWGNLEGSTIQRLYNKDILETPIVVPPTIKEQQKIGAFFKNLDDQIEAEEAKLEKLKQMKEAYLEEMFV